MTDQQSTGLTGNTELTDKQSAELSAEGVPQDALRRLAELRPGRPGGIFTSDLSVNEFLLLRATGFEPASGRRIERQEHFSAQRRHRLFHVGFRGRI